MSATSSSNDDGRTERKTAKRAFAREFDDAIEMFQESDEERAPKYALLPTGERANRLFVVGTLTEVENIGKKSDFYRGRVVGPTGTFFTYAGQYQPDAMEALQAIDTPEFVAVVGKPRIWERDDDDEDGDEGGNLMTQLTPESITVVDQTTRDRWVVETAGQTLGRIAEFAVGEDGDIERAIESYGEDIDSYQQGVMYALADVAGIEVEDAESDGNEDE